MRKNRKMRKKKFFFTFSMKNQINPPPPLKKKIHRLIVCDERNVNERTVHHSYRVSRYRVSGFIRNESLFPKKKINEKKRHDQTICFCFVLFFRCDCHFKKEILFDRDVPFFVVKKTFALCFCFVFSGPVVR